MQDRTTVIETAKEVLSFIVGRVIRVGEERLQSLRAELVDTVRWPAGFAMFAGRAGVLAGCEAATRVMENLAARSDSMAAESWQKQLDAIREVVCGLGYFSRTGVPNDLFDGWFDLEEAFQKGRADWDKTYSDAYAEVLPTPTEWMYESEYELVREQRKYREVKNLVDAAVNHLWNLGEAKSRQDGEARAVEELVGHVKRIEHSAG